MQAPKDPPEAQAPRSPIQSFDTRSCTARNRTDVAFQRGFIKGLHPLSHALVKVDSAINQDSVTYRLGAAMVHVGGLELMVAADPEALGHAKGQTLRDLVMGAAAPLPEPAVAQAMRDALTGGTGIVRMERVHPDSMQPETVPGPQVVGWSGGASSEGGYGVVTLAIEGEHVRYVPERGRVKPGVSDFDHWEASPYTRVYEKRIRLLQRAISDTDSTLSRVLHELAGEASLCWEPKPVGVFDSSAAIVAVERAIGELRAILRSV